MDNRSKPSRKPVDELVLTKSAAWAWHQRGSEFNGNLIINEFHGLRNKADPKPSRYKLEAMKRNKEAEIFNSNSLPKLSSLRSKSVHFSSSSLLDEYEIERIFRAFDYYSELSASNKHYSGGGYSGGRKAEEEDMVEAKSTNKSRVKKNKSKWIWPRDHELTCGSSINDVVKSTSFEYSLLRSRSKKSHVAVVDDVGCRNRFQGRRQTVVLQV